MRKLFILLAAGAVLAVQAPASGQGQDPAVAGITELRAIVGQLRDRLLQPGERVAQWNVGGDDPDAEIRRRGAERHYMLSHGDDGDSVGILTSRPITELAPEAWRVIDSYGEADAPLDSPQVDFQHISPRYVFASRTQWRRRGDVDCTDGITNALLYEVPDAPTSAEDDSLPIMFRLLILALEGQELCVRSDDNGRGGYSSRIFLPDGRLLPELTPDGPMEIVPAAPVDRLINWREPAPEGAPAI